MFAQPSLNSAFPAPIKKRLLFGGIDALTEVKWGIAFVPSLMNGCKMFTEPGNTSFCARCPPNTAC